MAECEWNPKHNRPARTNEESHATATVIVGGKVNWMLCMSCSGLPRFKRFKKRKEINNK